jgi:hypothetical protein
LCPSIALHSKHGAPCCDGPEAMHLSNVDWTAPDSSSHKYRARIPKIGALFDLARQGFEVESKWVDVLTWPLSRPSGGWLCWREINGLNRQVLRCRQGRCEQ